MLAVCVSLLVLAVLGYRRRPGRTSPLGGKELIRIRRFSERQQMNETVPYG